MKRTLRCLLLIAAASLAADCFALPNFRTVALTGQLAPGVPGGGVFEEVFTLGEDFHSEPQIDDHGRVSFSATFNTLWPDFVYGHWSEGTGTLELVAGDTVPPTGVPPTTQGFFMFAYPTLDRSGNTYFWGMSSGPGLNFHNNIGIWTGKAGSLSLVLHGGMPAPGLPPGVLFQDGTSSPVTAVSADGQMAFHGYLQGPGINANNGEALWTGTSDSLQLLARTGEQAPGTSSGHLFVVLEPNIRINATGDTAFIAAVTNPSGTPIWKNGIWSHRSGATSLVALSGEQAPGTSAGTVFSFFDYEAPISNSGRVAFLASVSGAEVTPTNREGIWRENNSGLELVARTGNPAPGTGPGTIFSEFHTFDVRFDANDNILFVGTLTGGDATALNDSGVWRVTNDSVELIFREGDQAPGAPAGTVFAGAPYPATNALGQMAFLGVLRGSGVNDGNNLGIWASDRSGQLHLIVRKGELFEVAPGDLRTITELRILSTLGYNDSYRAFNDKGQLAFGASFSDGTSGVFVSNLVAVPEPVSAILAVLGAVTWAARRRSFMQPSI